MKTKKPILFWSWVWHSRTVCFSRSNYCPAASLPHMQSKPKADGPWGALTCWPHTNFLAPTPRPPLAGQNLVRALAAQVPHPSTWGNPNAMQPRTQTRAGAWHGQKAYREHLSYGYKTPPDTPFRRHAGKQQHSLIPGMPLASGNRFSIGIGPVSKVTHAPFTTRRQQECAVSSVWLGRSSSGAPVMQGAPPDHV